MPSLASTNNDWDQVQNNDWDEVQGSPLPGRSADLVAELATLGV